mgnify:CR=1 FL=1
MDGVVILLVFCFLWHLALNAARRFFAILAGRFDIPAPYGVHPMAADHPEQVPAELTEDEEAAFEELRSNWDRA